ncbi:hypothetical protein [Clostridium sp. KNHs214]|uniref:hypothetical protein n=1 Tax=Clostridium sp. KNHs214 TaxID=1540257 RepID=UPI0005534956|nr:hypothetical protein [Clostridium sp. KNHs214]
MKQAIIGYINAMINEHIRADKRAKTITDSDTTKILNKRVILSLEDLLDYVADIPEVKSPVTVVLNEGNCKCEIYKQVLGEVLSNLRSIDSPNPADSYIDESIEIIKKVMEETK